MWFPVKITLHVIRNHSVISKVHKLILRNEYSGKIYHKDMQATTMSNLMGEFKYFQIELKFVYGDGPNLC